jgi:electron transfer flavoprotein alpha subunit
MSWETLAAGHTLGEQLNLPVHAVLPGAQTDSMAAEAATKKVARVVRLEHAALATYTSDAFTLALEQFIRAEHPDYVVFPHTYQVRDYAPALAARFGRVLIGDVTGIGAGPVLHPTDKDPSVGAPVFVRQLMQGRLSGEYRPSGGGICFVSVQSGAFHAEQTESVPATVEMFTPKIEAAEIRTKPSQPFRGSAQTVDLGSAQLIVSVGRGIKEAENLPIVQELAAALGAELAASRPICDSGWLPIERQVGSSGQTVSPKLYLAVGISGAIQHLVGMKGSQCVVAINKDPDAPIFEIADFGIVGDLFEVVPALTEAVKAAKR